MSQIIVSDEDKCCVACMFRALDGGKWVCDNPDSKYYRLNTGCDDVCAEWNIASEHEWED